MVEQLTIEQLEDELRTSPKEVFASKFPFDVARPEAVVSFIDNLLHQARMDLAEAQHANSILHSNEMAARLASKMGQPQSTIEATFTGMDFSLRCALLVQRRAHDLWPDSETSRLVGQGIVAMKDGLAEVNAMRRHPDFKTVH